MKRTVEVIVLAGIALGALALGVSGPTAAPAAGQDSYPELAKRFQYGAGTPPVGIQEKGVQERAGVKIHDITYASPKAGRVPAYLVVPEGKGHFAGILWAHWMMPNSPAANRSEFLDEAVVLAHAGAVSLLIDAPMVRPDFKPDADPFGGQNAEMQVQETVEMRRGLDLLLARPDVDPKRIAVVGHSFGAVSAAMLDAMDKRPTAFVFMGNPVSSRDFLTSDEPMIVEFRKKYGDDKIKAYLEKYSWADAADYAKYLGPAPALFQYATHDEFMTVPMEQKYFDSASGPKEVKFYAATHALDDKARIDRYEWLKKKIGLGNVPAEEIERVPQTR